MPDTLNANAVSSAVSFQERIEQQIADFRRGVPDTHYLLASVFLPGGHQIIASWFGHQEPDMLVVEGTDERGRQVRLLVSSTQLHIVLAAVKRMADRPVQEIQFQSRPA
jgi:hypothetical protein